MIKRIVLFTALLLPVLIFVFLKFFGKNEFELPVYYEEAMEVLPAGCGDNYELPYRIPTTALISENRSVVVAFYDGLTEDEILAFDLQLNRLDKEFNKEDFDLVVVSDSSAIKTEKDCLFLMGDNRVVLVDDQRRIRGYYVDSSLKEMDRLILELQILLKRY